MKLTLSFWSSRFDTWPKSQDKNLKSWERKELLRWNKKQFSSILKGFHLPKTVAFKIFYKYMIYLTLLLVIAFFLRLKEMKIKIKGMENRKTTGEMFLSVAYLRPYCTSMMEFFAKLLTAKSCNLLPQWTSIIDIWHSPKCVYSNAILGFLHAFKNTWKPLSIFE